MNEIKSRAPSDASCTWRQLVFNFIFKARWTRLGNSRCFRKGALDRCDEPDGTGRNADAEVKSNGAMQSCSPGRHRPTSTYWMACVANNRQAHRREKKEKRKPPNLFITKHWSAHTLYFIYPRLWLIHATRETSDTLSMNDQLPSNHSGVRRGVSGGFTAEKDQGLTFECMYTLKHTHTHTPYTCSNLQACRLHDKNGINSCLFKT